IPLTDTMDTHNTVDSHIDIQSSKPLEWYFQALKEGRIVKFKYSEFINVEEIGQGGYGIVYSADYGDQKVALKRFTKNNSVESFANEIKQIYTVNNHDNINRFHGITTDPEMGDFIMVLQFARGGNLRDYLKRQWNSDGFKISLTKIIQILEQIVQGLNHLHTNNIIHRDLGEREVIIPGTPKSYVDLYQKCWSTEPEQRPTLKEISKCLGEISKEANNKFIIVENDHQVPQRHPSLPDIFPSSPNSIDSSQNSVYFSSHPTLPIQVFTSTTDIITKSHVERISSWIYGNNVQCKLKLLYIGNRDQDGLKFKGFHEKCDNESRTLVVTRIRATGEIIGGYNPIEWKTAPRKFGMPSREYGNTIEGFIFSFQGERSTYSKVENADKAIYYKDGFGPCWGKHDLSLRNDMAYSYKWCCKQKNYRRLIRLSAGSFDAENYQ
ncbi:678_t:CDS:2, partial [Cetraspora pellucida]